MFKFLLPEKRTEVGGLRSKLQYGLDTLASAGEDIARLQIDLREKEPRLVETQKEVEVTMASIAIDKRDAAVTKEAVEAQETDAAAKAAECGAIRDDAQSELDKALPMLDKAVACLNELNKAHIDEVRNFKKPPSGVILTMEAASVHTCMQCARVRHSVCMASAWNFADTFFFFSFAPISCIMLRSKLKLKVIMKADASGMKTNHRFALAMAS